MNVLLDLIAVFIVVLVLVKAGMWLRRWSAMFAAAVKHEIPAIRQKSNRLGYMKAIKQRWKEIDQLDDEEAERLAREAFGGHEDVWIDIDGQPQRVLGDPNMSEETKQALAAMIKAATEAVARGDFDNDETEKESK